MNWFYADGNRQNGPVSDAQLDELVRSGKVFPNTLVWREGMSNWQPLSVSRPATQPSNVCVECGKAFPPEELIRLNNSPICAQCKPVFLQRMAEAAVMPSAGNLWRYKKQVVTRSETFFPDRCVKCNASAGGFRLKRTLYWAHPAYLLFIFCSLLPMLIIYLIVRKKAVVHIGLCEAHRSQRKLGFIIGWSSFALGLVLIVCAGVYDSGACGGIGLLLILAGAVAGAVMARTVSPMKIDKDLVWVSGVHRDFLAELPEWGGP